MTMVDPKDIEVNSENIEKDILINLHDRTHSLYENRRDTYKSLTDRAIKLVEVNGLLLTIISVSPSGITGIIASILFLVSAIIALFAYTVRKVPDPPSYNQIDHFLTSENMTSKEYHLATIDSVYRSSISKFKNINRKKPT